MATHQYRLLTKEALQFVAARFKVLSEPLRLQILHTLQDGERSVTAITEAVGATQPNVSKHLKTLQEAGIVARRNAGTTVYYAIVDPSIFTLCEVVCSSLHERFTAHASVLAPRPAATRHPSGHGARSEGHTTHAASRASSDKSPQDMHDTALEPGAPYLDGPQARAARCPGLADPTRDDHMPRMAFT